MAEWERGFVCGAIAGVAVVLWFVLPGAWPMAAYVLLLAAMWFDWKYRVGAAVGLTGSDE